ncbi:class F sortase [Candidatus Saccharibacteria bacterium]|nr:class F sortase [Candidatus Saccharibacteria bacterium]
MRIHKSWRSFDYRKVFTIFYVLGVIAYIAVGLSGAKATEYEAATDIEIPSIGLTSDVVTMHVTDRQLNTPDYIVGRYSESLNKTLLVGHSSTIFANLHQVSLGDAIIYDGDRYIVSDIATQAKLDISMAEVLAPADRGTIIIMTCAGEDLGGGDATHRLIITAVLDE